MPCSLPHAHPYPNLLTPYNHHAHLARSFHRHRRVSPSNTSVPARARALRRVARVAGTSHRPHQAWESLSAPGTWQNAQVHLGESCLGGEPRFEVTNRRSGGELASWRGGVTQRCRFNCFPYGSINQEHSIYIEKAFLGPRLQHSRQAESAQGN